MKRNWVEEETLFVPLASGPGQPREEDDDELEEVSYDEDLDDEDVDRDDEDELNEDWDEEEL